MEDINTDELKKMAPIVPYIKSRYSNIIHFTKETDRIAECNCIWHEESTPSLKFFKDTNTYKCYGECGKSGDVITLVEELENIGFIDACKQIGDDVGYEINLEPPNAKHEAYKDKMNAYNVRYTKNLFNDKEALSYLMEERKIKKEFLLLFRIGVTDYAEYKYRDDLGGISHRISFPILEHNRTHPKCVGMAYRTLRNEKPKYINDPNQEGRKINDTTSQDPDIAGVFIKGNLLYGYPMAYNSIIKNGYAILTEGYLDVISMHQTGISNTVGVMGTSITKRQIQELAKITKRVVLMLDGDSAGQTAMLRPIADMYEAGLEVIICILPNGIDPADLCKKYDFDKEKISLIIKNSMKQSIQVVIDNAVRNYENSVIKERILAIENAMPIINAMPNEYARKIYKDALYKRLNIGG